MSWIGDIAGGIGEALGFGESNVISRAADSVGDWVFKESDKGKSSNLDFLNGLITTGATFLTGASALRQEDKALKRQEEAENMNLLLQLAKLKYGQGGGGADRQMALAQLIQQGGQAKANQYARLGESMASIYK